MSPNFSAHHVSLLLKSIRRARRLLNKKRYAKKLLKRLKKRRHVFKGWRSRRRPKNSKKRPKRPKKRPPRKRDGSNVCWPKTKESLLPPRKSYRL